MNVDHRAADFIKKIECSGSVLGLESIRALLEQMGNPQDALKVIHVAGTNGKGSCCCMLQNILTQQGYAIGMYTSPAVFSYEERYTIDGRAIEESELNKYLHRMESYWEKTWLAAGVSPTLFEVETAMAFLYFKEKCCDYVILEVGMGGLSDATNIIKDSLCSVFCSIGRDHMQFLGNSLGEIAEIKAGIMKQKGYSISTWQLPEVETVLKDMAEKTESRIRFAEKDQVRDVSIHPLHYQYKEFSSITIGLEGTYQLQNSVLVLEVVRCLRDLGIEIQEKSVLQGMKQAKWPGRMERICQEPQIYIDGAHNLPAAEELKRTIERDFTNKTITYIIGVLADKEHEDMMKVLLPLADHIYTITPENPRAMSAEALAQEIRNMGFSAKPCSSIEEALQYGICDSDDRILAFGSLSYLGTLKKTVMTWAEE